MDRPAPRRETVCQPAPDADLLDLLPVPEDLMTRLPTRLHAQLYDAFGIELLYRHDPRQVTIHATLIASTPWDTGNPPWS